ncbi:protein of unassigned function [Methylobacterium oryzae CBMB20]|uniref:Protein of unassigned function n=1 Tax=Methylobacterium oryzae CBMB20 TaxID=693986 RepID=A0A089NVJ4_9HYPH|nr:protein of unassigned function [Methylobacterium oryzae CBMB20]
MILGGRLIMSTVWYKRAYDRADLDPTTFEVLPGAILLGPMSRTRRPTGHSSPAPARKA